MERSIAMGISKAKDKQSKLKRRFVQRAGLWKKHREKDNDDDSKSFSLWKRLKCSAPHHGTESEKKSFTLNFWGGVPGLKESLSQETKTTPIPTTIVARSHESIVSSMEDSSMSIYAAATAAVAKEFYSENANPQQSILYRPTQSSHESQLVHPVACKRDIFVKDREVENEDPLSQRSFKPPSRKPLARKENILKPYSISGSMLCENMEKGKIRHGGTSAPQNMFSPPKPSGLPPNSIRASMLYRTMQHGGDISNKIALQSMPSHDSNASTISSLTNPSEKNACKAPPPNTLLEMFQSSSFEDFIEKSNHQLYEA